MPSAAEHLPRAPIGAAPLKEPARSWSLGSGRWPLAALVAALVTFRGLTLLFDHSLHSIDGAMQTWFALDGFASGARLGEDFQSYLGVTMMLALLPGFLALGQTLFASTFTAYAAVIAGAFGSAYAIAWFIRAIPAGQRAWWAALIVFSFYYLGRAPFDLIGFPYPVSFEPGVSLRPLRGLLPFLTLPAFVWTVRAGLRTKSASPAFALGALTGLGLLWSNDAGIPLVIASVIGLVAAFWPHRALMFKTLTALALGTSVSAATVAIIATQGDPSGWLQYNFVAVTGDQFWYFGPWTREARVLAITDFWRVLTIGNPLSVLTLVVLAVSVVVAFGRRILGRGSPVRMAAFVFVGASLVGTALIPQIGGHIGAEYNHITFVLGAMAPVIVLQSILIKWGKLVLRAIPEFAPKLAALAAAAVMVALEASSLAATARASDRSVYNEALGFYVTPAYAADIDAMSRLVEREGKLLSVYTSALDVASGAKSAAPVGSLIHALGEDNRAAYTALLTSNDAPPVTAIAPDYSGWGGWNMRANWPFFETLRMHYRPVARGDQQVLWMPSESPTPAFETPCRIEALSPNASAVILTSDQTGVASVRVKRSGAFAQTRAALLTVSEDSPFTRAAEGEPWGGFPRYGVANAALVRVAAPVEPGIQTTLTLEVMDGSAIGEATCTARVLPPIDFTAVPGLEQGVARVLARGG